MERILTLLIGIMGGIAVGVQSPIAGAMSERVGGVASSLIVHVGGAILSGLLLLTRGGENIQIWRTLPWYMLITGVFGVIVLLTLSHTFPRLGAAPAITLIIVGQLATGVIIDQFGWFGAVPRPIDLSRLLGAGLLLMGGYLVVR